MQVIIEQQVRANANLLRRHKSEADGASAAHLQHVLPSNAAEAIERQRRRSFRGGPMPPIAGYESIRPGTSTMVPTTFVAECVEKSCRRQPAVSEAEDSVPLLSAERTRLLQKQIEIQRQKRLNAFLLRE